jgi:hypothetical protein
MPAIAFFPWCTITESITVGDFELTPFGMSRVAPEIGGAISEVFKLYGKTRAVDRATVPVLRRVGTAFESDLAEEELRERFEFRERLAFSVLSAREYFRDHRYANSENVRMVVQGFTIDRAGSTMITSRRRDGHSNNIILKGSMRFLRPQHALRSCELPRDLDLGLLNALGAARAADIPLWAQITDAVRLFVGANSDSPDIGLHNELVDVISAFSRLGGVWKEAETVQAFTRALPSPPRSGMESDTRFAGAGWGPRFTSQRMVDQRERGKSVREVWLSDANQVRSEVGHGRLTDARYPALWAAHEHLLLAAVALPLYVKALLREAGVYAWSSTDDDLNEAFDVLATVEPFSWTDDPLEEEGDASHHDRKTNPWLGVLRRVSLRRMARAFYPNV